MARWFRWFIVGLMGVLVTASACGGASSKPSASAPLKGVGTTSATEGVGSPISLKSTDFGTYYTNLTGEATLTVLRAEVQTSITDKACGTGVMKPKGHFIVVFYTLKNDFDNEIQPASLNANAVLSDSKDRKWKSVENREGYCFLEANAAEAAGFVQPAEMVGPGFSNTTATVFDVPTDATGFSLNIANKTIRLID